MTTYSDQSSVNWASEQNTPEKGKGLLRSSIDEDSATKSRKYGTPATFRADRHSDSEEEDYDAKMGRWTAKSRQTVANPSFWLS